MDSNSGHAFHEAAAPMVEPVTTFREDAYDGSLMYLRVEPDFSEKILVMRPAKPFASRLRLSSSLTTMLIHPRERILGGGFSSLRVSALLPTWRSGRDSSRLPCGGSGRVTEKTTTRRWPG